VIGLSIYVDEHIVPPIRDAGADGIISKTASAAKLVEAIYSVRGTVDQVLT
jgi:DNA-binding NarL/FixJ family response regulator